MRRHAAAAGLDDAVIVNTCAVTGRGRAPGGADDPQAAAREPRRAHHRHRLRRADRAASASPTCPRSIASSAMPRRCSRETFRGLGVADSPRVAVNDIMSVRETAHAIDRRLRPRARAFVQVQNGCDHRCTFCIIPYGRGPSRSVPAGEVVAQVRRLVEARLRRDRADRRRHHRLRRRPAGRHDARQAGAADPAACAGAHAAAPLLDRPGRGRPAPDGARSPRSRG